MEDRKQRVIVYVDGFNFYFGLKAKKWRRYYWLDLVKFFESFLKPHQELVALKYFSAVQKNSGKADRQDLFFQANKLNSKFHLELGKFLQKQFICRNCQDSIIQFEEKETDVRIATHMLSDVVQKKCDISIRSMQYLRFGFTESPYIFVLTKRLLQLQLGENNLY